MSGVVFLSFISFLRVFSIIYYFKRVIYIYIFTFTGQDLIYDPDFVICDLVLCLTGGIVVVFDIKTKGTVPVVRNMYLGINLAFVV